MVKKLTILLLILINLTPYVYADETRAPMPGTSKAVVINKYYMLATIFGAGTSQCHMLTTIIKEGWPEARFFMILDMMSAGISQEEASLLLDRNYNGAASLPPESNIIQSCDLVLDTLYKFQSDIATVKAAMSPSTPED